MTTPPRIDQILGSEGAGAFIRQCADDLAHQDQLAPGTALRLACERVADGDPLLIAAPGQTWTLREDVDIDDAPARRLQVHARLTTPPRVLVSDLDDPGGEIDELLLEVLDLYELTAWTRDLADLGVS
ncbi:hypothetical protein [Streptomyces sp. BPTC-684]|uniref:hypothetical protein n=1 Tax=Streptomyces sp. BPTC-684 TaxID=3043734 RepID=UPI0024B12E0E|nr:hypothetical protein [Streptomyces sp. BPTC-684]WHM41137.1 hypothetical protein QIY60_32620 [Streptomyces sp. BPTC-684]